MTLTVLIPQDFLFAHQSPLSKLAGFDLKCFAKLSGVVHFSTLSWFTLECFTLFEALISQLNGDAKPLDAWMHSCGYLFSQKRLSVY
jgi:hypothetical protein